MKFRQSFLFSVLMLLVSMLLVPSALAVNIQVKMLSHGSALLVIEDTKHFMHEGEKTQEGVTLISANPQFAVIEYKGEQKKLEMAHNISTEFKKAEKNVVRIASSEGSHYRIKGYVNSSPVNFLVDTGATYVALSSGLAERLHLDYRAGQPVAMNTANGMTQAFLIDLDKVTIGSIVINHVPAVVISGDMATDALLGNSYLSKVDMKVDSGVLVLTEKY